ncbi:MAG: hypothetical protein R3B89_13235 [Polyangiaceae bacterium]
MSQENKPGRRKRGGRPLKLIDVLRAIPEKELQSLVRRLRINVDEAKRIDVPSQVARALVGLPELKDPGLLPGPTRELLYRIAEEGGLFRVDALPVALEPLAARGLVFARGGNEGVELILPVAFLLELTTWEGENPRGLRALLAQASADVKSSVATHYLGRPATPPFSIALEDAWEVLSDADQLAAGVDALAPMERNLLQSIEHVGGEVDTEELLELEREPLRLRGATGATPSRRGVGFALERRGFLIPVHPNRHVIPTEVAVLVGAKRQRERERMRREIRELVLGEDHAPRRARFSEDPVPLTMAMALSVRDPSVEVKPGVGTPRSLLNRFSTRFGRDLECVSLLAALSRATGVWDPAVVNVSCSPGSLPFAELGGMLFEAWKRGGAWDEARPDAEVLRAPRESREASSVGVIREMVLEALSELGEGRWVPWSALAAFVRSDARTPGVARLLERWAGRLGIDPPTPIEVARRIVFETLFNLGVVDLGDVEDEAQEGELGTTVRLTPRGRAYLSDVPPKTRDTQASFLDTHALRFGAETLVGHAVAIAPFVEIGRAQGHLDVIISPQSLSRALSAGFGIDVIGDRLRTIQSLPDPIERMLVQASAVLGRAEYVPCQGFLWVDDAELCEMLRSRRQTMDLFVDPSPPGGLLIAPGVELERLAGRCRALGIEVVVEGNVYRTKSTAPPRRSSASLRMGSESKTRRSTGSMKAVKKRSRSSTSFEAVDSSSDPEPRGAKSGTRRARGVSEPPLRTGKSRG